MEIVQDGHPALRKTAERVPDSDFGSAKLKETIRQMEEAVDAKPNGVALAAPQIGVSLRIFIVRYDRMLPTPPEGYPVPPPEIGVFINPEIIKSSRRKVVVDEGCLSVDGVYGQTVRHERATVRARDIDGNVFERGGGGLLAQAFQHEIDHLNGTLFTDHAALLGDPDFHDEA